MRRIICFLAAGIFVLSLSTANASHFRYGHLSWKDAGGNSVEFEFQNAWRRSGYVCIDSATLVNTPCTASDGFPGVGDIIAEFVGFTTLNFGDGTAAAGSPLGPLMYQVTSIDPVNDWLFGLALDASSLPAVDTSISHTYAAPGNYTALSSSCCRIGNGIPNAHINNPNGGYQVETIVDAGSGNSSPVTVQAPIQVCPINAICEFVVPGADADGDLLNFRLSTATEAGGSFLQPGVPGSGAPNPSNVVAATGEYVWDTNGATVLAGRTTLYSTQVSIEDATSKSAVDFFITLDEIDVDPPEFDEAAVCSTTEILTIGNVTTFDITVTDPDAGDIVQLNVVGLPGTATMAPTLPVSGNPVSSTFSWTPGPGDEGVKIVNFFATSSGSGVGRTECPVVLEVRDTLIVGIDIRPFAEPNVINLRGQGVVSVAILSSDTFDATTVDASTVTFGVNGVMKIHKSNGHFEDADADGDLDLVLHFRIQETGILCEDLAVTLTGETFDGQAIEGSDAIETRGCE